MNPINFLKHTNNRLYLNDHTPEDFNPFEDPRNFKVESIEELLDLHNYQTMRRKQLKARYETYAHLYGGLVKPSHLLRFYLRTNGLIFKTYVAQTLNFITHLFV